MNFKDQYSSKDSSTLDTVSINLFENKELTCDQDFNFLLESNLSKNSEEYMPDITSITEKTSLNKSVDELSEHKHQFSNLIVKEENKTKSNEIINEQQAEKKTKRNKFIINKADYQKSGYQTKIISHRSSNCKNKILRNLIQDIIIDWLSITNNKRSILRLKKLSKNNLEVIYKNYMNIKDFRLKEIYSGEYLKETSEKDRHIFEFNKKLIETSENMEAKLNCSFKQAFNYFNNKESIISSQNSNILSGIKSKNEYINEKKDKEFLEKNIQKLFEEINHEKAQSKDLY
jgi:hypothetical protein